MVRRRCTRQNGPVRMAPARGDAVGERFGIRVAAPSVPSVPTKSVSQNAQTARARSASRPDHKLQPAKRAEYRRPTRLRALALQRVEDLLDGVAHL